MNVLVCEDRIGMRGSIAANLMALLKQAGHPAWLFDGRKSGQPILAPARGVEVVAKLILDHSIGAMVVDLNFFGDETYGAEVLLHLRDGHNMPDPGRIVVYSNFLQNNLACLRDDLKIPDRNIFDRSVKNEAIVKRIAEIAES